MNISSTKGCYGCGVCAVACPKGIIDMKLDGDGFYEPEITDTASCIDCGVCVRVCSFRDDRLSAPNKVLESYAAWSREPAVRRLCSSGGAAFEIGRSLIGKGYKVCGVKYDAAEHRAKHYIASTADGLKATAGSKYIQSYTVDGFRSVGRKGKWLVTGTPCQIDSFRRWLRLAKAEDGFILMDFFCHGVPSMLLFDKYISEKTRGWQRVTAVSWRDKAAGWHDSWAMSVDGEIPSEGRLDTNRNAKDGMTAVSSCTRLSQGDGFFRLFLCDQCLGKACYDKCKFKYERSSADIRIGDLWGKTYADDENGVTAVAVFTDKGRAAVEQSGCELTTLPFETVAEGQMKTSPKRDRRYAILGKMMRDKNATIADMTAVLERHDRMMKLSYPFRHPLRMMRNIVMKRILRRKR